MCYNKIINLIKNIFNFIENVCFFFDPVKNIKQPVLKSASQLLPSNGTMNSNILINLKWLVYFKLPCSVGSDLNCSKVCLMQENMVE